MITRNIKQRLEKCHALGVLLNQPWKKGCFVSALKRLKSKPPRDQVPFTTCHNKTQIFKEKQQNLDTQQCKMHNIQYDVTKYAKKQEYVTYNQEKNC